MISYKQIYNITIIYNKGPTYVSNISLFLKFKGYIIKPRKKKTKKKKKNDIKRKYKLTVNFNINKQHNGRRNYR